MENSIHRLSLNYVKCIELRSVRMSGITVLLDYLCCHRIVCIRKLFDTKLYRLLYTQKSYEHHINIELINQLKMNKQTFFNDLYKDFKIFLRKNPFFCPSP